MDIKKWVPWNWFRKEEDDGKMIPVRREEAERLLKSGDDPMREFHHEMDRVFDRVFRGFGGTPFGLDRPGQTRRSNGPLKPTLDLGATDKEYTITVEIPGVDEKDVTIEVANDTLTIRGEKKQEKEEKEKNYYRMERSYGSFQRMLSLPEDADQDKARALFKNGVLTVALPRKSLAKTKVRQIEVKSA